MAPRKPTKKQKTEDPAQGSSVAANYQSLANSGQYPAAGAGGFTGQPAPQSAPQYAPGMASTQARTVTTNPAAGNNVYYASTAPTTGGFQAASRTTQNRPVFNASMHNSEQGDVAPGQGIGCGPSYRFFPIVPVKKVQVGENSIATPTPARRMEDKPTDDAAGGHSPLDTAMANLHLNDTNFVHNDELGPTQDAYSTSGRKNHPTAGNKPGAGSGPGDSTGKTPKDKQDNAQHKATKRVETPTARENPTCIFYFNGGMKGRNNNNGLNHNNNDTMKHKTVNVATPHGQDDAAGGAGNQDGNTWELAIAPYIAAGNHLEAVIQLVKRVDDNHGHEIFNLISTDEAPWARLVNHYYHFPSDHQTVNPQHHAFILFTAPCHGLDESTARRLFRKLGVDIGVWPRILDWWQKKDLALLPKDHRMQKLAFGSPSSSEREDGEQDDAGGVFMDQKKLNKCKKEAVTNHSKPGEKFGAAPPNSVNKPNTSIFTGKSLPTTFSSAAIAPVSIVQNTANSVNYPIANPGTAVFDRYTTMHGPEGPTTKREGPAANVAATTSATNIGRDPSSFSAAQQQERNESTYTLFPGKDDEIIRKFVKNSKTIQHPYGHGLTINLRELVLDSEVWGSLSPMQRAELIHTAPDFPGFRRVGPTTQGHLSMFRNNDDFRSSVTRYQDDLTNGQHDSQWVSQAKTANQQRALGDYAPSQAGAFEKIWGVKMPDSVPDLEVRYFNSTGKKHQLEGGMAPLQPAHEPDLHFQMRHPFSVSNKSSGGDSAGSVPSNANANDTAPAGTSSAGASVGTSAGNTSIATVPGGSSSSDASASMYSGKQGDKLMEVEYDIYA